MLASLFIFYYFAAPFEIVAVPAKLTNSFDSFLFAAIPFFLLAGLLVASSGILDRLLELSRYIVGKLAGGLGHINVLVSMMFAGVSGSAAADAAGVGAVMIPAMKREGYPAAYSAALTAAASTIGPVIPPSIAMVVFGALVGESIGKLFIAGVLPGIFVGILLMIWNHIYSRKRGFRGSEFTWTFSGFCRALVGAAMPLLVPGLTVGGIISGLFTPTEAANVVLVIVLFLGFIVYRSLSFAEFWRQVVATVDILGPIMLIIGAAAIFAELLIVQRAGEYLTQTVFAWTQNVTVILLAISFVVIILGCFIEGLAIILLVAPLTVPLLKLLGVDMVHYGIVLTQGVMIGLITPPVGISMFITCSIAGVSIWQFTRELLPFFIVLTVAMLMSIFFPSAIMFLPRLLS
jgi:C4-dicarboxylate transporter DctM subunit